MMMYADDVDSEHNNVQWWESDSTPIPAATRCLRLSVLDRRLGGLWTSAGHFETVHYQIYAIVQYGV